METKKRLIVADDDFINSRMVKLYLEKEDYQVDVVTNGVELIEKLKHEAYDIILLDWLMPKMNGFDAAKSIRFDLNDSDTPIIVLTNNRGSLVNEPGFADLRISKILTKPVSPPYLFKSIKELIRVEVN
ncbi:MAG: response regulator [Cyclobacteriaceae bacterium]